MELASLPKTKENVSWLRRNNINPLSTFYFLFYLQSSILLDLFEKLSEIGLYMSLIQEHFSVFMDFNWLEDHLLRVMCNLRKIYHRHGESDHHSNTLLQSATKYSLCIKHNTNCANFYVWLLDKLQTVNNKMDRVVTSSRRFELQGQYHV